MALMCVQIVWKPLNPYFAFCFDFNHQASFKPDTHSPMCEIPSVLFSLSPPLCRKYWQLITIIHHKTFVIWVCMRYFDCDSYTLCAQPKYHRPFILLTTNKMTFKFAMTMGNVAFVSEKLTLFKIESVFNTYVCVLASTTLRFYYPHSHLLSITIKSFLQNDIFFYLLTRIQCDKWLSSEFI